MNTIKSLFGVKSRKENAARAAEQEASESQIRSVNNAAEARQVQASELAATRRQSRLGRKQLMWLPLGGQRTALGNR